MEKKNKTMWFRPSFIYSDIYYDQNLAHHATPTWKDGQ